MVANNAEHNARFEKTIQAAVAFYAALTGFGLKLILDAESSSDYLALNKWPFFIVAMLLFVRVLTGAANHLWVEYVEGHPKYVGGEQQTPPHVTNRLLIKDVAFLTIYGLFAELMCYATTPQAFFRLGMYFLLAATAWSALHLISRYKYNITTVGDWRFWVLLDLLMAGAFGLAWAIWGNSLRIIGWNSSLTMLVTISIIFFSSTYTSNFNSCKTPVKHLRDRRYCC
jgi:hypothetical protein